MNGPLYIAVDLGAGSGRVFLAAFDADEFVRDEVHRFRYPPNFDDGHLRWNFRLIFDEIKSGLRLAGTRASVLGRRIASIAVDSWGVDYGLVGTYGKLVAHPICYRDSRTDDTMTRVFEIVPRDEIFEKTGIQFQKFNTLYQLFSEGRGIENASMLLLLPDLINYLLTGRAATEYTNATTTQMVNALSADWDADLIDRLGLSRRLLQEIIPAGTKLGPLLPEIAKETGLDDIDVIAPGTHDTASAVAATPLIEGSAYISSGTWSLIGIEHDAPLITPEAAQLNFTNEGGVYNTFRFLKNVMGLWIFESCRKEWAADGNSVEYEALIQDAEAIDGFPAFIFPDDERFLSPVSMLAAINKQLSETGQQAESDPAIITKIIFDSLAFRYASVLRSIESLTNSNLARVEIVGGGGRNRYLNQSTANATGLLVRSGLTEATVVGNVLVQAIASGRFESLSDARAYVASKIEFENFLPRSAPDLAEAEARYLELEERFETKIGRAGRRKMKVALFVTCLVDQLCPNVGMATVEVLERAGCTVTFDERQTCCGQPAFNTGYRTEAREFAKRFIEIFENSDAEAIVIPSGSCAAMVKHYHEVFADEPNWRERADRIAAKTHELSSFLVNVLGVDDIGAASDGKATWHDACHGLRDLGVHDEPRRLLKNVEGLEFVEMQNADVCCGFGGTFSVKFPEISAGILDNKIEMIEKSGADTVVACDASCLMQIAGRLSRLGSKVQTKHIAEVLASRK